MGNLTTLDEVRAYDQQESLFTMTTDEQLQVDLFQQFWLYAIPPADGTDIYSANFGFIVRKENTVDTAQNGTLAKAKGLRANTKAVFNFVPQIVAKNKELISNQADFSGVKVLSENGETDKEQTELLQKILKPQWKSFLPELLLNGLVTGNTYIMLEIEKNGNISFNPLFSNHVFVKSDPKDIRKIEKVEIKYTYYDDQGIRHDYFKEITAKTVIEEIDGTKTANTRNPFGWIPIIKIKNISVPGKANGYNCFSQHISAIDELNEIVGDWLKAVSLYGHPHIITEGAAIDGDLKMDVGQTIHLPEGGKISLLEYQKLGEQWDKIHKMSESIKQKIVEFDLSQVEEGLANMSGFAIMLRLGSLIAKIQDQQEQYEEGIARACEMVLNILNGDKVFRKYDVEVDLGPVLPPNIMEKITEIEKLKMNGWITDEQALHKLGIPQNEIDEILAEKEKEMQFAEDLAEANRPTPDPKQFRDEKGNVFEANHRGELEQK